MRLPIHKSRFHLKCLEFCRLVGCVAALAAMTVPSPASASVAVYGGPTYDQATQTGYRAPELLAFPAGNDNGVSVGTARYYSGGAYGGERAVRWDASGAAIELGDLGTGVSGYRSSGANAVNGAGAAVGYAYKYIGGADLGKRAVRWDTSGAVTELANLGTRSDGFAESFATAINTAGAAAGSAFKYSFLTSFGSRAVRWNASGAVTELGTLGTDSGGGTYGSAHAINTAGTVVGAAEKYTAGTNLSFRAVRWDASGTSATELGNLGTDGSGVTFALATAINTAGVAIGFAQKYTGGVHVGPRAVRWDASGTSATELGNLGTSIINGSTNSVAYGINDAGAVVGVASKITGGGSLGPRAVRWDASGTSATELGNLGTDSSGVAYSQAYAINTAGAAVGYAAKYTDGTLVGDRAVLWNLDGGTFDLNTLIDSDSGWTLTQAYGISNTNWVTGIGLFDPDGAGPLDGYGRYFLLDASSVVPEPAGLALLSLGGIALLRRRAWLKITYQGRRRH
jgi:MYXO-CTERM domain-containing protein